ncbi:MAG TPA: class I SAM-dependent methyltransferase [Acidimicrobiales bacterium]
MLTDARRFHDLTASTREILLSPGRDGGRSAFLRRWLRYPMEYQAARWIDQLPIVSVPELFEQLGAREVTFPTPQLERRLWNLGALEQAVLCQVIRSIEARAVFEIGTFDGATTRLLASSLTHPDGRVFTLDLPEEDFWRAQPPESFDGTMVGERFRGTPEEARILQLRGDSLTFDFSPWYGAIDVVLVDGCHDYVHGVADSRTALRLVRPGGWIFWDDIVPRWHGLVRGIAEATRDRQVFWIEGTSLAALRADGTNTPNTANTANIANTANENG